MAGQCPIWDESPQSNNIVDLTYLMDGDREAQSTNRVSISLIVNSIIK